MRIKRTCESIEKLLDEAESSFLYGGGENEDGSLEYGWIDWDKLKEDILKEVRLISIRRTK